MDVTWGERWDLRDFFPQLGGEEQKAFNAELAADLRALIQRLELLPAAEYHEDTMVQTTLEVEKLLQRLTHVVAYSDCVQSEDVNNAAARRFGAEVRELNSLYNQADILCMNQLYSVSDEQFASLTAREELQGMTYWLERWRFAAQHAMSADMECLNAELAVPGFDAWERLYVNMAGRLEFDYTNSQGETKHTSMNAKVSLLEDSDPEVRRTTLLNSNKAWENIGEVVGACLNSIAGYRLKLLERRHIAHHLDNAAFEAGLSRRTLQTMFATVSKFRPVMRAYLKTKAKLLSMDRLGFQDAYAPVNLGQEEKPYTWPQAQKLVKEAFAEFSPYLAEFAAMALDKKWVNSLDYPGKSPGGFCTSSQHIGQSRILLTFLGNYGDVSTLAHELGHAWHEWLVRDIRSCASHYPMTLAETASNFAERLLGDHVLADPALSLEQRAVMLMKRLDDGATNLLNIPMRFEFEDKFYNERRQGEVSVERLQELMVETQRDIFGDALDPQQLDPWFWASKGHFYITDVSFYNFPYTFGYLFSLGVYARAKQEGPAFVAQYRDLLRLTGACSCEDVARRALGADLQSEDFWQSSLQLVEDDYRELDMLLKYLGD